MLTPEQYLDSLVDSLRPEVDYEKWADEHKGSELQMVLAAEAIERAAMRPHEHPEPIYKTLTREYETPPSVPMGCLARPQRARSLLAVLAKVGLLEEVMDGLRWSVTEKNGCIVVVDAESGRLIAAMSAGLWQQKVALALQPKPMEALNSEAPLERP